jgi:hypothetical protein
MYSSTPQRPISCTCWENQRKPQLDIVGWVLLTHIMLTYADVCWRMPMYAGCSW